MSPSEPTRVLQFGEGVFLRAFVDVMLDDLRRAGRFAGGVTIVKPRPNRSGQTTLDDLRRQNGAWAVALRGLRGGEPVDELRAVDVVRDALDPGTQWDEVLEVARDPALRFVFSNTTEAGIAGDPADNLDNAPPASFPAKLASVLRERFRHFGDDASKGVAVLPCELIERNGGRLRELVLKALDGDAAAGWVAKHCAFADTLVDRIVVGTPDDRAALCERLDYDDRLLVAAEPFGLFAIDGPPWLRDELPLDESSVEVVWGDVAPVRERKVRLLNGLHVVMAILGPPLGAETTREAMEHAALGPFLRATLRDEILPRVPGDPAAAWRFADQTIERMLNPHVRHRLAVIATNLAQKFEVRLSPTIRDAIAAGDVVPPRLSLALAALLEERLADAVDVPILREPRVRDAVTTARQCLTACGLQDEVDRLTAGEVSVA